METFYIVLLIAFIIFCYFVLPKIVGRIVYMMGKTVNKNVLFRKEYKEQQEFVTEKLTFKANASIPDIKRQLSTHVAPVPVPFFLLKLSQTGDSDKAVVYAFASKWLGDWFTAAVEFANNGEVSECSFKFVSWTEHNGMVKGIDAAVKLREDVVAAFTAADPNVKIIGSDIGEVKSKFVST